MQITTIGLQLGPNPVRATGDQHIGSDYVARWWLPVLGPTATLIMCTVARDIDRYRHGWRIVAPWELSEPLGLGANNVGKNSPLIRSMDRLARFGRARWEAPPTATPEPRLTIFETVQLVPARITQRWTGPLQHAHTKALAELARAKPAA